MKELILALRIVAFFNSGGVVVALSDRSIQHDWLIPQKLTVLS